MYTFSFCEGRFVMYLPITYFVKKEYIYTVKKYITSILAPTTFCVIFYRKVSRLKIFFNSLAK